MIAEHSILGIPHNTITVVVRISACCNLACHYCYARASNASIGTTDFMTPEIASLVCEQFLSLPVKRVDFNWHGGEPLLCDPLLLRHVLQTQKSMEAAGYASATNKIQTNGRQISDEWMKLFCEHPVDIGVSLDGPARFHDRHRIIAEGGFESSHNEVMETISKLRTNDLTFGALVVVTEEMADAAKEVFDFIATNQLSVDLLPCFFKGADGKVAPPSIRPGPFTRFIKEFFETWIRHPAPPTCRMLEDMLGAVLGIKPSTCAFRQNCHNFFSVDTEGRLYPCDLFLGQPNMCLGDLRSTPLSMILNSIRASTIRSDFAVLPVGCRECAWIDSCGGGCAAHRIGGTSISTGQYYYCGTRKAIFRYLEDFVASNVDLLSTTQAIVKGSS